MGKSKKWIEVEPGKLKMRLKIEALWFTNYYSVYAFKATPWWKFWDSGKRLVLTFDESISVPQHIKDTIKQWHEENKSTDAEPINQVELHGY